MPGLPSAQVLLKELQKEGLGITNIARDLGLTRNYISLLAHGHRECSSDVYDQIARLLRDKHQAPKRYTMTPPVREPKRKAQKRRQSHQDQRQRVVIEEAIDRIERRVASTPVFPPISTPPAPVLALPEPERHRVTQRLPDGYAAAFEQAFGVRYRPELTQDENVNLALQRQAEAAQEQAKKTHGADDVLARVLSHPFVRK